jgi:hypothetical protein
MNVKKNRPSFRSRSSDARRGAKRTIERISRRATKLRKLHGINSPLGLYGPSIEFHSKQIQRRTTH